DGHRLILRRTRHSQLEPPRTAIVPDDGREGVRCAPGEIRAAGTDRKRQHTSCHEAGQSIGRPDLVGEVVTLTLIAPVIGGAHEQRQNLPIVPVRELVDFTGGERNWTRLAPFAVLLALPELNRQPNPVGGRLRRGAGGAGGCYHL